MARADIHHLSMHSNLASSSWNDKSRTEKNTDGQGRFVVSVVKSQVDAYLSPPNLLVSPPSPHHAVDHVAPRRGPNIHYTTPGEQKRTSGTPILWNEVKFKKKSVICLAPRPVDLAALPGHPNHSFPAHDPPPQQPPPYPSNSNPPTQPPFLVNHPSSPSSSLPVPRPSWPTRPNHGNTQTSSNTYVQTLGAKITSSLFSAPTGFPSQLVPRTPMNLGSRSLPEMERRRFCRGRTASLSCLRPSSSGSLYGS